MRKAVFPIPTKKGVKSHPVAMYKAQRVWYGQANSVTERSGSVEMALLNSVHVDQFQVSAYWAKLDNDLICTEVGNG